MEIKLLKKKNNVIRLFVILILLFPLFIFGQNNDIDEALKAYKEGNYNKSIEIYTQLIGDSNYSSDLYFNLGDSYYKKGDLGRAILYFEKALKLDPNNKDIKHNIYVVKRKIDSEIIELPDFFLKRWWQSITSFFSLGVWTFLTFIFIVLTIIWLYFYWINKRFSSILSLSLSIVFFSLFAISILASNNSKNRIYSSKNIILIESDSIYSAPDIRSDLLYNLDGGEKLYLIDSIDDWYRVKLLNKELGWIKKNNCEKI